MKALGNEQVDVAEMLLKRRKRRRVPAHIKCGAHGIIGRGNLAQRLDAAQPPGSFQRDARADLFNNRMKRIAIGWEQRFRQTRADQNADKKSDQQKSKNRTADF